MAGGAPASRWTPLHSATFLYLYIAEGVDGDLDPRERDSLVGALHRQGLMRGLRAPAIEGLLLEAGAAYAGYPDKPAGFLMCAQHLMVMLPQPLQRLALLRDLYALARADGRVSDAEADALERLREWWELAALGPLARL